MKFQFGTRHAPRILLQTNFARARIKTSKALAWLVVETGCPLVGHIVDWFKLTMELIVPFSHTRI
jgi:hypothetical protein